MCIGNIWNSEMPVCCCYNSVWVSLSSKEKDALCGDHVCPPVRRCVCRQVSAMTGHCVRFGVWQLWLAVSVQACAPCWLRIGLQRVNCNQQVILTDPLFQEQTRYLSNVECLKNSVRWLPYGTEFSGRWRIERGLECANTRHRNSVEGWRVWVLWHVARGTVSCRWEAGCGLCEGSLCCHRHEEWTNLRLEFKAKLCFETSEARGHVPEDWATQLWNI